MQCSAAARNVTARFESTGTLLLWVWCAGARPCATSPRASQSHWSSAVPVRMVVGVRASEMPLQIPADVVWKVVALESPVGAIRLLQPQTFMRCLLHDFTRRGGVDEASPGIAARSVIPGVESNKIL